MKRFKCLAAILVLMAAVFLVYEPAQRNGFVWDDTALVGRDPLIRSWRLIPEGFRHFLFLDATASNFYRPMQRLTFTFDYAIGAMNPSGYHLTSVAVHAGACVLLYFLALRWMSVLGPGSSKDAQAPPQRVNHLIAFAVALIWAVHPLHTSAVTYVAGRADPLAALFGFGALCLALASLRQSSRQRLYRSGAATGFLLALLSKESGVFAVLVWILVLAFYRPETDPKPLRIRWALILGTVLLMYAGLRIQAEKIPPPVSPVPAWSARPSLAAQALAEYSGLVAAPLRLHMERDVRGLPQPGVRTAAGFAILAGFAAVGAFLAKRCRAGALALAAAGTAYLPISNILPLNATIAEHWLYVPSAFLLLTVGATVACLPMPTSGRNSGRNRTLAILLLAGVGVWTVWLGTLTYNQQAYWRDPNSFVTGTIAAGGDSARMRVSLGQLQAAQGHEAAALEQYNLALQRFPDLPFALLGIANVEMRRGNFPEANRLLDQAEKQTDKNPFFKPDIFQMRAALQERQGQDPLPLMLQAVNAAPKSWPIRKRFIQVLASKGHLKDALGVLEEFLATEDFRADSWQLAGDLWTTAGNPDRASAAYNQARALDVHLGK